MYYSCVIQNTVIIFKFVNFKLYIQKYKINNKFWITKYFRLHNLKYKNL